MLLVFPLLALLLLSLPQPAIARTANDTLPTPTNRFVSLITSFFQAPGSTSILDAEGNCINQNFFINHYSEFNEGSYQSMWDEFKENSLSIEFEGETPLKPLAMLTLTPSKSFYQLCTTANGWKTVEASITLKGTYTVNDAYGIITGANSPSLSVDYYSVGANFSATTQNASTWKTISSNKKNITFSGKFSVQVSQKESGVIIWTSNAGPYTKSFTSSV
ncbi:hypothetical protein AAK967_06195 [Atopobiaceae bacterium 24-176]